MGRRIMRVLGASSLALAAIAITYVLGIRSENSTVRNAARRFHRGVGNPLQMRSAGTPGAYAAVIRHRGRTTGRTYETPVWAASTEDGFVIAIVYGPRTDWLESGYGLIHDDEAIAEPITRSRSERLLTRAGVVA
jgi:hypothetical protein